MTSGQYTDNQTPLPLMERARRGLLADESRLWAWEIAEMEFPHDEMKRAEWRKLLHGLSLHRVIDNCSFGVLPRNAYYFCPIDKKFVIVSQIIPRDAYLTWRATQSNLPNDSMIHLWLGTTECESESKAQKNKRPSMFERRLESFMSYLNELEKAGDFDRNSIMEKKEELHDGLKKYDRKLWERAFSTFKGFLKQAHKEIDFFIHSGPRPQKPS